MENILIFGMVALAVVSFYYYFTLARYFDSTLKRVKVLANASPAPHDIQPIDSINSNVTLENLVSYQAALNHLLALNRDGKIQINQFKVKMQADFAIRLGLYAHIRHTYPKSCLLLLLTIFPLPIGIFAILGFVAFIYFYSIQASQFQPLYRNTLNSLKPQSSIISTKDVSMELSKLSDLFQAGLISDDEFRIAKAKALGVAS